MYLGILGIEEWKLADNNKEYSIEILSNKKNEIEIINGNAYFGIYIKSSTIINKRETFVSKDGKYGIWYDSENNNWNLGHKENMGSDKYILYLDLDGKPYFEFGRGFVFNSLGTEDWEGKEKKSPIDVSCSSKKGKSHWFLQMSDIS